MGIWDRIRGREARSILENPTVPLSDVNMVHAFLAQFGGTADAGVVVNIEEALKVPAVLAAVAFLSSSLASLPLHLYRKTKDGQERISGGLATLLHDAPNDEWSSFAWRKHGFWQTFTGGRQFTWIERVGGNIVGLWPLDPSAVTVARKNGRKFYRYVENGVETVYPATEIVDLPFALRPNGLDHYAPIEKGRDAIGLAIAMSRFASKFFAGGGVPPLVLEGPLPQGPDGLKRAFEQIKDAIDRARASDKPFFGMPPGHSLKPVGVDPDKSQMTEARRLQVEEIARLYGLPPVFLQDLTRGTFSNTEQQDLHLVKHTLAQWAKAHEQELNLKLFGQRNTSRYVEYNMDGLLRGDFVARMTGMAQAIQNGLLTPNEARALDNREPMPNGDDLLIQGATVPLGSQPTKGEPANAA